MLQLVSMIGYILKKRTNLIFYDRVEAKGNYITTTTGHSMEEFHSGRVALRDTIAIISGIGGLSVSKWGNLSR